MKIVNNDVFHSRFLNHNKELESSHGNDPILYLHGYKNIIVRLEYEMEGCEVGRIYSYHTARESIWLT